MDDFSTNKFNKMWNVDLVLDYIEFLANIKIPGIVTIEHIRDNDYHNLLKQRLDSVLSAYGRYWIRGGRGLIGKMSEDKLKELFYLISDNTEASDKMISQIVEVQKLFDSSEDENYLNYDSYQCVESFFRYLLYLYISLHRLCDPFYNMIESSKCVYESYNFISRGILSPQKEFNNKIKRILILMLGDDFDQEISEVELIEKYGYPEVTDEELYDLRLKQDL